MKHNRNHDNGRIAGPQLVPVHFEFTHPIAATIYIAGTFDDGRSEFKPMQLLGDGRWLKESVLPCDFGSIVWSWTGYGYPINWWPIPSGKETHFLRSPAHLKHLTSPRLDFCNQRTRTNRKNQTS